MIFGVITTGVYCRDGCPARPPLPKNVVRFATREEAEREGFRACKRCWKTGGGVLRACEFIARHLGEPLPLARIAAHAGWSPFHFQRVFRAALGVSPKEYARRLRIERFRRAAGSGVTSAIYAAGFGSSSRLYERAKADLGMTPSTLAKKGEGMTIGYDFVDTPVGRVIVAATPVGICMVEFGGVAELRRRYPRAEVRRDPAMLSFARERISKMFDGIDPNLPLDVKGTAFQAKVWATLRSIPYGSTRTYAEVARAIGRPRAVRAVARACATNPVAIVVPCHRVIGSDGKLHGYAGGLHRKKKLLEIEAR